MRRFTTLVVGLTVALTVSACGGGSSGDDKAEQPAAQSSELESLTNSPAYAELVALNGKARTFVGKVDGSDAYIAVVDNGAGDITVYACDSKTVGAWGTGELTGDSVSATSESGLTVDATINGSDVTGDVTLPSGKTSTFSATLADFPAGLWQPVPDDANAKLTGLKVGWIVLPDGTQRGLALTSQKSLELVDPVNTVSGTTTQSLNNATAGSSTGIVTTGKTLSTQCQTIQNVGLNALRVINSNSSTTNPVLVGEAKKALNTALELWNSQGCPGTLGSAG